MADFLVLAGMLFAALVPFALSTFWMQRGKVGFALTLFSLLGAGAVLSIFIASRLPHPDAMAVALLGFLPATLGCMAGALLGWLIYRRRYGGL